MTRDSIYVRAGGMVFPLARASITRLDTLVGRQLGRDATRRHVQGVIHSGAKASAVLGAVGLVPCLLPKRRVPSGALEFPCWFLAPLLGGAGIAFTLVGATLAAAMPLKDTDEWAPVSPLTYGLTASYERRGPAPVARPVVGWRVTF
ncbi:MAG: hypothetical protein MUF00_09615 [Gemmatimonadaceae bacterium]|nr:hypothetical protein [Gemmatimonadaceae bacterium]